MYLIIHRGTNEIGGSCVEIATDKTRILFDMGISLDFDKNSETEKQIIKKQAYNWSLGIDAIFISHYHQDHHGLLTEVESSIPVYTTAGTAVMFDISATFLPFNNKVPNINLIQPANKEKLAIPIEIGDIKITAFTVDHSAYDACAFLIEAEGKKILYSGDIRLHGKKGILYKKLPKNVDYLILEGTNIEKNFLSNTETQIEHKFVELFKQDERLNFIWCSGQHIDRLTGIYKAARKTGKTMVVDLYIASSLYEINKLNNKIPSPQSHGIKVLYTKYKNYKDDETNYSLLFAKNRITSNEINNNPQDYIVIMRPSMFEFIKKNLHISKANMITSMWKEYEKEEMPFFNWIEGQDYQKYHIHTSGHADLHSLKVIADFINPQVIIPIHTQHKAIFTDTFPQLIKLLEDNEIFSL